MTAFASACGGGPIAEPVVDDATVPQFDLYEQPVADAPDPADRAGAAANFVDCTYGLSNGGWSRDFGPPASASDPERALAAFLDLGLFNLPDEGYAVAGRDTDRLLYTYSVGGTSKVAVIVADSVVAGIEPGASDRWVAETYATCDPAEYDPSADDQLSVEVWVDVHGNRVPISIITSFSGAEHCGWQSVTYLHHEDRYYISDPRGVMDAPLVGPFDGDADLPSDAVDTGYRHDGRELWISVDETVAFLVTGEGVEAWPSPDTSRPPLCA